MSKEIDCWQEIIDRMSDRKRKGLLDYGNPVNADESINWLEHAESEFLDGAVYCRAAAKVMQVMKDRIVDLESKLADANDRIKELYQENRELERAQYQENLKQAMKEDVDTLHRIVQQKVEGQ